jgi:purine-binding chemotaxis protein CheW
LKNSELALVFHVETQRFAIPSDRVEFVTRAAGLTPLPHAPRVIVGLVNIRGEVLPVAGPRRRLGFPDQSLRASDYFIVVRTPRRTLVLIADAVVGLLEFQSDDFSPAEEILPNLPHVAGVLRHADGMILIQDLEQFLSLDEERVLDHALAAHTT